MLRLRGLAQVVRVEKCIAQSALLLHTEHLQPRSPASRNVRSESTSGAVPQRNSFAAVAGSSADAARGMARSKYEYVKLFEADQPLLLGCWIVIRLDGKAFTRQASLEQGQSSSCSVCSSMLWSELAVLQAQRPAQLPKAQRSEGPQPHEQSCRGAQVPASLPASQHALQLNLYAFRRS